MHNPPLVKSSIYLATIGFLISISGCETISRENIVSTINTGIGLTVAENPKTELYEVKVGYIRSQYYSVPTGKIVKNEDNTKQQANSDKNEDKRSNRADMTPQVVSGIKMRSGIEHLLVGMDVSENFAVGEVAVNSMAAVAMYVAEAQEKNAGSAANAVQEVNPDVKTLLDAKAKDLTDKSNALETYIAPGGSFDQKKLKDLAAGTNAEKTVEGIDSLDKLKEYLKEYPLDIDDLHKKIPSQAIPTPPEGQ